MRQQAWGVYAGVSGKGEKAKLVAKHFDKPLSTFDKVEEIRLEKDK